MIDYKKAETIDNPYHEPSRENLQKFESFGSSKQVTENLGNKGLGNKASLIDRAGHCN